LGEPELALELFPFAPEFELDDALFWLADPLSFAAAASGVAAAATPGDVAATFDGAVTLSLLLPCVIIVDDGLASRDVQTVASRAVTARPVVGTVVLRARPLVTLLKFSRTSPIGAAMRMPLAGRAGAIEGVAAGFAATAIRAADTGAAGLTAVVRVETAVVDDVT
jgi:hypothetical protein